LTDLQTRRAGLSASAELLVAYRYFDPISRTAVRHATARPLRPDMYMAQLKCVTQRKIAFS